MRDQDQGLRRDTASLVVKANPAAVYRAFGDADSLMAWLPPGNMTGRAIEYDFREGGRYRIELQFDQSESNASGKTTGNTDISAGRFVSLKPERCIVQTVEFESSDPLLAGEMIMNWSFEPVAEGTWVTVSAENVPAGIDHEDHIAGLQSSLKNLAKYLA